MVTIILSGGGLARREGPAGVKGMACAMPLLVVALLVYVVLASRRSRRERHVEAVEAAREDRRRRGSRRPTMADLLGHKESGE